MRLALVAALVAVALAPPARAAARCPTQTFLAFDHLAYLAHAAPADVRLVPGPRVGSGAVDEPASADGCKRKRAGVDVVAAGRLEPRVAVMVRGRPRRVFVLGRRCAGSTGRRYWDCLLHPLVFRGRRFTETAGSVTPGRPLGRGAVRRIVGVDPALAVAVGRRPYVAAGVCPYEESADLLRCLRSLVWFTFDPPGGRPGDTVVARADRPPGRAAGASVGLARLGRVADYVPAGRAVGVGRVGQTVRVRVPDVAPGLYEAVVSSRFPAGSLLVTAKPRRSGGIEVVSYALTAVLAAAILTTLWIWRRRRAARGSARG